MMKRKSSSSGFIFIVICLCSLHIVYPYSLYPHKAGHVSSQIKRKAFFHKLATTTAAVLGTGVGFSSPPRPANADPLPQTGTKAPAFALPNTKGGQTSLDDLTKTGKWTVLYFYPGAFTNGCTLEARAFQRDLEEYQALNAQIVGVSVDEVSKNASFCLKEKLDFVVLTDPNGSVSKLYGSAVSIPGFGTFSNRQTYLVDPDGNLKWVFTDVEDRVTKHSAEVLEKLNELTKTTA